jgi:nucleotide-binding universal stress UspA family protein
LADDGEAKFYILRIYPHPGTYRSSYLPHTIQVNVEVHEKGRIAATEYVDEKAEELAGWGISATGHVVAGTGLATGILQFAEQTGADLIAMSTHGRGGVSRLVLGSVTDKVHSGRSDSDLGLSPRRRLGREHVTVDMLADPGHPFDPDQRRDGGRTVPQNSTNCKFHDATSPMKS